MSIGIGAIIVENRKEKEITQQELADFIGVSKASVSKWENGNTYPDITILPLLAAYFNISIDTLLDFNAQLSSKQIQNIYSSLVKSFNTDSKEEVLNRTRSFIKRYYSCYPFILQMGLLIINHYDLFPGENRVDNLQKYMKEAQKLFLHIKKNSQDSGLVNQAVLFEAYTSLMLNEPDNVLEALGKNTPGHVPVEPLIASAYQMKNESGAAISVLQSAIMQNGFIGLNFITNYLPLLMEDSSRLEATYRMGIDLVGIYFMEKTNPIITLNFLACSANVFAASKKEEILLEVLNKYINILSKTEFPVEIRGNEYFDQIEEWINSLDLGSQMPRNTLQIKNDLIEIIVDNPTFSEYKSNVKFLHIFEKLNNLHAKEEV